MLKDAKSFDSSVAVDPTYAYSITVPGLYCFISGVSAALDMMNANMNSPVGKC